MAPNPKVVKAFRAMKDIGISEEKVKPVLKNLLKVYDKNWELIEEENYRALADAIFESDEAQEAENKKKPVATEREVDYEEEAQLHEEPERPLKRLRLRQQEGHPSSPVESEPVSPLSLSRKKGKQPISPNSQPNGSTIGLRDKGKERLLPQNAYVDKRATNGRSSNALVIKEPRVEPEITLSPKQKVPVTVALIKPKEEPVTDCIPQKPVPIAVIHPDPLIVRISSVTNGSNGKSHSPPEPLTSQPIDAVDKKDETAAPSVETEPSCKRAKIQDESSANIEIASSHSGEVKISLSRKSALGGPMPSLDSVLTAMEDKCRRSYNLDPNFSVTALLKDMCECFSELVETDPNNESQEKHCAVEAVGTPYTPSNVSDNIQPDAEVVLPQIPIPPPPCNSHEIPQIPILPLPQIPIPPPPCSVVDDDMYLSADLGEGDVANGYLYLDDAF